VRTGLSVSHQERKKLTSGKGARVPPLLAWAVFLVFAYGETHVCLVTGRGSMDLVEYRWDGRQTSPRSLFYFN
jgi:hypothetical protein